MQQGLHCIQQLTASDWLKQPQHRSLLHAFLRAFGKQPDSSSQEPSQSPVAPAGALKSNEVRPLYMYAEGYHFNCKTNNLLQLCTMIYTEQPVLLFVWDNLSCSLYRTDCFADSMGQPVLPIPVHHGVHPSSCKSFKCRQLCLTILFCLSQWKFHHVRCRSRPGNPAFGHNTNLAKLVLWRHAKIRAAQDPALGPCRRLYTCFARNVPVTDSVLAVSGHTGLFASWPLLQGSVKRGWRLAGAGSGPAAHPSQSGQHC